MATSRSVVTSPRSAGTRSLHRSSIDCRILTDGNDCRSPSELRSPRLRPGCRLIAISGRPPGRPSPPEEKPSYVLGLVIPPVESDAVCQVRPELIEQQHTWPNED